MVALRRVVAARPVLHDSPTLPDAGFPLLGAGEVVQSIRQG